MHFIKLRIPLLQNPNLRPETDPLTGELIPIETPGFLDKAMRHVVLGGEVLNHR